AVSAARRRALLFGVAPRGGERRTGSAKVRGPIPLESTLVPRPEEAPLGQAARDLGVGAGDGLLGGRRAEPPEEPLREVALREDLFDGGSVLGPDPRAEAVVEALEDRARLLGSPIEAEGREEGRVVHPRRR